MAGKTDKKRTARLRRHRRMRTHLSGTAERPRLNVYRSNEHIYAQVIDDVQGHTLVSASTVDPQVRGQLEGKTKTDAAKLVGDLVARRAVEAGITNVIFDRGGWQYHGRVKALAEAAREAGLEF
jgi:large subunit ribosomal protein L18